MSDIEETGATEPRGISRRTVAKAMAWSVPVIAVAAAAPIAAASEALLTSTGEGCKLPGNSNGPERYKGYVFGLRAANPTNVTAIVTIVSATLDGGDLGAVAIVNIANVPQSCTSATSPFTVTAHTTYPRLALITTLAPDSQNGVLVIKYTINGGAVQTFTETVPAVPPINGVGSCQGFTAAEKLCIVGQAA